MFKKKNKEEILYKRISDTRDYLGRALSDLKKLPSKSFTDEEKTNLKFWLSDMKYICEFAYDHLTINEEHCLVCGRGNRVNEELKVDWYTYTHYPSRQKNYYHNSCLKRVLESPDEYGDWLVDRLIEVLEKRYEEKKKALKEQMERRIKVEEAKDIMRSLEE